MAFPGQQYRYEQQQGYYPPQNSQNQGYNPGYGNYGPPQGPPPQSYGQQSNYVQGSGGFRPTFQAPPGPPPPSHYGSQNQANYYQQAPPQYHNMPVHFQPDQQNYGGQTNGPQPFFQYSNCTGRRKALCIGINYRGQKAELRGCVNDAINMQRFLVQNYNFKEEDIVMLLDADTSGPRQIPTRENMIAAMQWLVRDAQPNESLFFHYSGHGGSVRDTNGDEDDGMDETIYPLDHQYTGQIVDDDLHEIMVRPLPPGCRLTAIFDSCHSATALDLPYVYSTEGKIKEPNLLADAGSGAMAAATSYLRGDLGGTFSAISGFAKKALTGNKAEQFARQTKTSPADVISWSGCKDSQTSADTQEAGQATGAMSYAFITALSQYPQQSYIQLLNSIRDILSGKYSQKPQLSASHPMVSYYQPIDAPLMRRAFAWTGYELAVYPLRCGSMY